LNHNSYSSSSSPSFSGTVFGVKAYSRFNHRVTWHYLAIKAKEEQSRGGGAEKTGRRNGRRTGKKKQKRETKGETVILRLQ
jgi:hypothetical protein